MASDSVLLESGLQDFVVVGELVVVLRSPVNL